MENQLELIVKDSGLDSTKASYILEKFQDYFLLAAEWEKKAKAIIVTDSKQETEMKMARVGRLFLRDKRLSIEKARKTLKEQALREGKAIDGIANVLKALIVPLEDYLLEQEKFVEIKRKKEEEAARIEEEKKAEEDRIAKEKAEAKERERIRLENEQLKEEAEERERILAEERKQAETARIKAEKEKKKQEEKRRIEQQKAEKERKDIEEKDKLEREIVEKKHQEKLQKERKNRQKAEAELQAKKDAEEKETQEERERIASQKKASDKIKLSTLADTIKSIEFPQVTSKAAKEVLSDVNGRLLKVISILRR